MDCLFPAIDTEFDPLLSSPDFLEFLSEDDLTGPLPVIPDASQGPLYGSPELTNSSSTAVQLPACPLIIHQAMHPQQIHLSTTSCLASVIGLQPAAQLASTSVPQGQTGVVPLQQHQQVLQLQPSCTTSTVSSDASAGRMIAASAPGSPVSSQPTPSSSDISSLPVRNARFSTGTSATWSAVHSPAGKRLKQHSGTAVTEPGRTPPDQEQKPLTKQQIAANKRRAPEVDWRSIDDPAERRRQRRLAKNRVTAARSRERKKEQMADMEDRMSSLQQENAQMQALLASLTQENTSLKEQLASLTRGAAVFNTGSSPEPAVRKCLAIMHLVACLTLTVKASFGLVWMLVSVLVQQGLLTGSSAAAVVSIRHSLRASASHSCAVKDMGSAAAQIDWLLSSAASWPWLGASRNFGCAAGVVSALHMAASAA